jgi:hypothetical protein
MKGAALAAYVTSRSRNVAEWSYGKMSVSIDISIGFDFYVLLTYAFMYVYVCMYVCIYVCVYVYVW